MFHIRREAKPSPAEATADRACAAFDTARADVWKVERALLRNALATRLRRLRQLAHRRIDTPQWMV